MIVALFSVENVLPLKQKNTLVLEGIPKGEIISGMFYRIPLNRSFGMTVKIDEVIMVAGDRLQLISCFEDEESFDFVLSMNIGKEIFEIHDQENN